MHSLFCIILSRIFQRFINEDHLSVHMKKHDMSLALNLGVMPGGLSPMGICGM